MDGIERIEWERLTTDAVEQIAIGIEANIARQRAVQADALAELDRRQVPLGDGCKSLHEWAAGRLDVEPDTARRLVGLARCSHDGVRTDLAGGEITVDRALAEARLVASGAGEDARLRSRGWDVAGVRQLAARHRRLAPVDERRAFEERFLTVQPNLDESRWDLWGRLAGVDGGVLIKALDDRADGLPGAPDGRESRAARRADALVMIAQDSLDAPGDGAGGVIAMVFVDAALAARTVGEAGAEVVGGPRVGPEALREILCGGRVEVVLDGAQPLAVGSTAHAIPPRLRRFVLARDGGTCTADGCTSRYRLQPHHIRLRSHGGRHDPANLTTLCWYHHHVIVHGRHYQIDPTSPPQRRRFHPPQTRAPPR